MTIRWRLAILMIQLVVLGAATTVIEGQPVSREIWYVSGLLAIVINPQLLEPYYPRPGDVVANSIFGLVLVALSSKNVAGGGWLILTIALSLTFALALIALGLGAGREATRAARVGRAARVIAQTATARAIYSAIFWLAVVETTAVSTRSFWTLALAWVLIVALGAVNWQAAWSSLASDAPTSSVEGLLAPSRLLVSAPNVPSPGTAVEVEGAGPPIDGVVLRRIRRTRDTWAEILISNAQDAETLLQTRSSVRIRKSAAESSVLGSVDPGSTHHQLRFTPTTTLRIGECVSVRTLRGELVLYQLASAEIREARVKDGSELVASADAEQVGVFDEATLSLTTYPWVPDPGAPVVSETPEVDLATLNVPESFHLLGHVSGTGIPVFFDLDAACEGHTAILGMTKMVHEPFHLSII